MSSYNNVSKEDAAFYNNTREKRSESRDFPLSPNTLGPLCRNILPPYPPFITPRTKKLTTSSHEKRTRGENEKHHFMKGKIERKERRREVDSQPEIKRFCL